MILLIFLKNCHYVKNRPVEQNQHCPVLKLCLFLYLKIFFLNIFVHLINKPPVVCNIISIMWFFYL